METSVINSLLINGAEIEGADEILSEEALSFLQSLEENFGTRRLDLLKDRLKKQDDINKSKQILISFK